MRFSCRQWRWVVGHAEALQAAAAIVTVGFTWWTVRASIAESREKRASARPYISLSAPTASSSLPDASGQHVARVVLLLHNIGDRPVTKLSIRGAVWHQGAQPIAPLPFHSGTDIPPNGIEEWSSEGLYVYPLTPGVLVARLCYRDPAEPDADLIQDFAWKWDGVKFGLAERDERSQNLLWLGTGCPDWPRN